VESAQRGNLPSRIFRKAFQKVAALLSEDGLGNRQTAWRSGSWMNDDFEAVEKGSESNSNSCFSAPGPVMLPLPPAASPARGASRSLPEWTS
jgi:hypothetical protein